jgi:hypothetical protein
VQSLEAAIVVDASSPGIRPAAIPEMKPVSGHPGVVQSRFVGGELVARRIPQAWLLVEGGSDPRERVIVLAHLSATTRL